MATFDNSLSTAKLRQQCFRNIHGGGRRVLDGGNMEVPAFLVVELISVYGLAPISRSRSHPTVKFRQRKEKNIGEVLGGLVTSFPIKDLKPPIKKPSHFIILNIKDCLLT